MDDFFIKKVLKDGFYIVLKSFNILNDEKFFLKNFNDSFCSKRFRFFGGDYELVVEDIKVF